MLASFAMPRSSGWSYGQQRSLRLADHLGGPGMPSPGCGSRPSRRRNAPAGPAEKGRDAAQPAEPALAKAVKARRALVNRELVEALPGVGPLPPSLNPWLEQCRHAAIEQRDHGALFLDGDPVRLVKQRQSGRAGFLGEGTVNQIIEWRR